MKPPIFLRTQQQTATWPAIPTTWHAHHTSWNKTCTSLITTCAIFADIRQQIHLSTFIVILFPTTTMLLLGRTSLSLVLGNMVVAMQILLMFNLSYLPCSVQFVNKNDCHAKNNLFTTCCCHCFVRG